MAEGGTFTFTDADGYAAGFGNARVNLTITGAGDFQARLTRLRLNHLELWRCREILPRIAYISFPPEQVFLSFPVGTASLVSDGLILRNGDMILHGRGESIHQRSRGASQWGLIALSLELFETCSKALTGREISLPPVSRTLHPALADISRFRLLFREACYLAEAGRKLIQHPEVVRALEQKLLHAIINCVATGQAEENAGTRRQHTIVMARFEESLGKHFDERLKMSALCTEIGVPERSLRMCCAKFLGVSPARYLLLRRLNQARSALRRADPSIATVAEVARNHQFLELGRFAVTYRATFGESPSVTLHRYP
jgi:AraC-like DNA-binding protein